MSTQNTFATSLRKAFLACLVLLSPSMADATPEPVPGNQDWEWVRKGSGCNFDRTNKVSTDICGYVYAAGSFHDTAGFTNQGAYASMHLTSNGGRDGFVAKYSAQGRLLWVAKMGGALEDETWDVSARWDGLYAVGYFQNTMTVHSAMGTNGPSITLTSAGSKDMFLAKYNPNGSLMWAHRFGGSGNDEAWSVSASLFGDVYFGGSFENTVAFKGNGSATKTLISAGSMDGFMTRIDCNGNIRDAFRFGGSGNDVVYGVTAGIFSTYFCGTFENSASGNAFPSGTRSVATNGGKDAFVGKFNALSDSKLDWIKGFGGTGNDIARQVALYLNGDLTLTGYFANSISFPGKTLTSAGGSDVMVVQYNNKGTFQWATRFGGTKDDEGRGIANNLCGTLYVAGMFQDVAGDEEGNNMMSAGNKDVLVWKLDQNGHTQFIERAGGNIEDQGRGIAILGRGAVVAGMYFRYASFGQETSVDATECGSGGAFVAGVNTGVCGAARMGMEESLMPALQIFPVPATDRLSIMLEGMNQPEAIRLYDQQGRLVKQEVLTPALQTGIDVSTLPRGLYTVQVAGQRKRVVLH